MNTYSYIPKSYYNPKYLGVRSLVFFCVVVFFIQIFSDIKTGGFFTYFFGLKCSVLETSAYWSFLTYMFLHGSLLHLFLNMFALGVFGSELEKILGFVRFIFLFLICGVIGGLGWIYLSCYENSICIGASGAVFGIIGCFSALFPKRRITMLLFFIFPITLRAKFLAMLLGFSSIVALMQGDGNIAHAAHLFGGVAGFIYGLIFKKNLYKSRVYTIENRPF